MPLEPGTFTDIAVLAVLAVPLAGLVVVALAQWRLAAGSPPMRAWRRAAAEVGIVHGTMPFVWMTLLPGSAAGEVAGRVSLVPLQDLVTMSQVQVVGNLLVFAALGFLGPLRFAGLASVPRVVALAAAGSVLIEVSQYALVLDRVSSVDDVLLNTTGAGIAALLSRALVGLTASRPSAGERLPQARR